MLRYFTPEEMTYVLENVSPSYLPWVCFAAFSGLRSEEIHARTLKDKLSLDWSQVYRGEGHIELLPSQSKNRRRRLVPICPALEHWLEQIQPPKSGRIAPGAPTRGETLTLGRKLDERFNRDEGRPRNVLRHTYATYRIAQCQQFEQVAREMDDSPAMLRRHYDGVATKKSADTYWRKMENFRRTL